MVTHQQTRSMYFELFMDSSVIDTIQTLLTEHHGSPITSVRLFPVGGGSVNEAYKIISNRAEFYFAKINSVSLFPSLFTKEKNSLEILAKTGAIAVPRVIACKEYGDHQILILEWVEPGLRTEDFWRTFGRQLAQLHQITNACFGGKEDNYMGALPQYNPPLGNWTDFFIQQRLEPQIRLAFNYRYFNQTIMGQFRRLYHFLPEIFPDVSPSLLHGDLWKGNFLCNKNSKPVLIDPAVYFGYHQMDLAMTTLFGGFDSQFYEVYQYHIPLPTNYREIWKICNLYPLLVHLNLFGMSYLQDIVDILRPY